MVYVDMNVRPTARVSVGEVQRCIADILKVGYAIVCVNVDCEINKKPDPAAMLPDLPQVAQKDKSKKSAKRAQKYTAVLDSGLKLIDGKFSDDKELTRQRKRITLKLEEMSDAQKLMTSDVVKDYDVVAAEALTPKVFQYLCEQADIDLITFDVTNRLPFQLKRPWITTAMKRGLYFEITYTPCLGDTAGRRYFFSNASNLVRLTNGKNLVLSSAAARDILLRSPYDVLNIGLLIGLKYGQALDAISTSCLAVLEHADKRRGILGSVQVQATEDVDMV
ncbi:putative RNase P subunit p30, polymerase/histidinol phosphatase [Plasmopara halstedii]